MRSPTRLIGLLTGLLLALGAIAAPAAQAAKPTPVPDGAFVSLVKITPDGAVFDVRCDATAAAAGDTFTVDLDDYITNVASTSLIPGPDGAGLRIPCASDNSVQRVTAPIRPERAVDCATNPDASRCIEPLVKKNATLYGVTAIVSYSNTPVNVPTRTRYDTVKVVTK
jgi:hypothetical protein